MRHGRMSGAALRCSSASDAKRPSLRDPQSRRRALPPAKDVGILAMTLSVIANSRLRTVLPTIHFVDALEYQKTSPQAVEQITNPHPQALSILSYLQKNQKIFASPLDKSFYMV